MEQQIKVPKHRSDELVLKEGSGSSPFTPKITENISAWKPFPNELLTCIKCWVCIKNVQIIVFLAWIQWYQLK